MDIFLVAIKKNMASVQMHMFYKIKIDKGHENAN